MALWGRKPRTLADRLAPDAQRFFEGCRRSASTSDGQIIPNTASVMKYPHLHPDDVHRVVLFHKIDAVLIRNQVSSIKKLPSEGLSDVMSIVAPYIMEDQDFQNLLDAVPNGRKEQLMRQRASWRSAISAPRSRVRLGEDPEQALRRIHANVPDKDAYELGCKALASGDFRNSDRLFFLAPHAIERQRRLSSKVSAADKLRPAYQELSKKERVGVHLIFEALRADPDLCDLAASLVDENAVILGAGELLYVLQKSAGFLCASIDRIPDPLPMNEPVSPLDNIMACDAAVLVARESLKIPDQLLSSLDLPPGIWLGE